MQWDVNLEPFQKVRIVKTGKGNIMEKRKKYICLDCYEEFDAPVVGTRRENDGMLLNGCPHCGCSSIEVVRDEDQ